MSFLLSSFSSSYLLSKKNRRSHPVFSTAGLSRAKSSVSTRLTSRSPSRSCPRTTPSCPLPLPSAFSSYSHTWCQPLLVRSSFPLESKTSNSSVCLAPFTTTWASWAVFCFLFWFQRPKQKATSRSALISGQQWRHWQPPCWRGSTS